jgi:hypothetical protein
MPPASGNQLHHTVYCLVVTTAADSRTAVARVQGYTRLDYPAAHCPAGTSAAEAATHSSST